MIIVLRTDVQTQRNIETRGQLLAGLQRDVHTEIVRPWFLIQLVVVVKAFDGRSEAVVSTIGHKLGVPIRDKGCDKQCAG